MAFRSSATAFTTAGGSITATPAGVVAGDYLGMLGTDDSNGALAFPFPSGWTLEQNVGITLGEQQGICYGDKIATGSDSFTVTDSNATLNAIISFAFSGRNTGGTLAQSVSFITPTKSDNATVQASPVSVAQAGGTTNAGDDLLWCMAADLGHSVTSSWSFSTISGFTMDQNGFNDGAAPSFVACSQYQNNYAGGATGTLTSTATVTGTSNWFGFGGVVVAIKAALTASPSMPLPAITRTPLKIGPYSMARNLRRPMLTDAAALTIITQTAGIPIESLATISQTAGIPIEELAGITQTSGLPIEVLQGLSQTSGIPIEELGGLLQAAGVPIESLGSPTQTGAVPIESLATTTQTGAVPIESLSTTVQTGSIPIEALQGILQGTGTIPIESLQGLLITAGIPIEALGLTPVSQTATIPIESLGVITQSGAIPAELLAGVITTAGFPIEATAAVVMTGTMAIEVLQSISKTGAIPIEALQYLATSVQVPIESLLNPNASLLTDNIVVTAIFAQTLTKTAKF